MANWIGSEGEGVLTPQYFASAGGTIRGNAAARSGPDSAQPVGQPRFLRSGVGGVGGVGEKGQNSSSARGCPTPTYEMLWTS